MKTLQDDINNKRASQSNTQNKITDSPWNSLTKPSICLLKANVFVSKTSKSTSSTCALNVSNSYKRSFNCRIVFLLFLISRLSSFTSLAAISCLKTQIKQLQCEIRSYEPCECWVCEFLGFFDNGVSLLR